MKMLRYLPLCLLLGAVVVRADQDVTTGATVTLSASMNDNTPNSVPSDLVDGVFQPNGTYWQSDSVWWTGTGPSLTIDLASESSIDSLVLQGDDNDTYEVDYRDSSSGAWSVAAIFGPYGSFGLNTRPAFDFSSPIDATQLRVEATGGDDSYAVSQVEAFGSPISRGVPDPASTLVLCLAALPGLLRFRRR